MITINKYSAMMFGSPLNAMMLGSPLNAMMFGCHSSCVLDTPS